MKFKKCGQIVLALVVSLGLGFGVTSCSNDFTVAYLYVTGTQYNQVGAFKIANNTGNLSAIPGSPFGSGGTNPIREIVSSTGRFLYILNQGVQATDGTFSGANINVYSIGGDGTLAPQQSYTSQGTNSTRFSFSSTGSFLYVLDQYMPKVNSSGQVITSSGAQSTDFPCPDPSTPHLWRPTGDITAFSVDTNTGRLSLITNNQVQADQGGNTQDKGNPGSQLTTFPIGCFPTDFKVTGGFVLSTDNGPEPGTSNRQTVFEYALNATNGQLTLTQNSELVTGAQQISTIGSDQGSKFIYILDSGANRIFYYTIGGNGLLQTVNGSPTANDSTAADPIAITSDSSSKFIYVANALPGLGITNPASEITGFVIASNGNLQPIAGSPFSTDSGPQCIIEDPSKQYIYTANFISSTVKGLVLDPNSGVLTPLRNKDSYATVGNPTWCVASGHTD